MRPVAVKKQWILDQERGFARDLASRVIETPGLSMWMILIPIILVYHVYRHKGALKGRSDFVEHYLLSRVRCLEAACVAASGQREPDVEGVVSRAVDLPDTARPAYSAWIALLMQHYSDLLRASGADFGELVRGVYRNRSNYLLFLNRMNQLEKDLNAAVHVHMEEDTADVTETILRIEAATAELRRLQAEVIFP